MYYTIFKPNLDIYLINFAHAYLSMHIQICMYQLNYFNITYHTCLKLPFNLMVSLVPKIIINFLVLLLEIMMSLLRNI